jgi:hypothetical protein
MRATQEEIKAILNKKFWNVEKEDVGHNQRKLNNRNRGFVDKNFVATISLNICS